MVKVYTELVALCVQNPDCVTWASLVRDLLLKCGMGTYWIAQDVGSHKLFLSMFKRRVKDIYLQDWWAKILETSTGRLYQHIKEGFRYEPYLDLLSKATRIATTRIRLSSHNFNIERGRWARLNRGDRRCTLCNVIECEYHVLVSCPRFVNERRGRLPAGMSERPCMFEFLRFMKSDCVIDVRMLGRRCLAVQLEYMKYM